MTRIVVLGGLGQFGRTAVLQLRSLGLSVLTAARRRPAELLIDANDREGIRNQLRPGDIVLDAAGPFHSRNTALLEASIEIGFDVIDINDNFRYAESAIGLATRINSAGNRVLSGASSVSAISAAVLRHSGVTEPRRITACLAPATRHTSNVGALLSLTRTVGKPVRVLRDGRLQERLGWSEAMAFPMPKGHVFHGRLFESAEAVLLPLIWPTLEDVSIYVDTNTIGVNTLLRVAAQLPRLRRLMERFAALGGAAARGVGSSWGALGYEIEDATGRVRRYAFTADENSFLAAVAPAVLAACAISQGQFAAQGFVLPNKHVEPGDLVAFLQARGVCFCEIA